jgi:hypothetical protein
MNWGKTVVMGVFQFLCLLLHEADAQKRWDGETGDGLWNTEANWSPNGVPDSTDLLVFDNFIIPISYTITLPPGANQIKLISLSIQPSPGQSITLIIPETNTAVPAINLSSAQQSITICNGGHLINRSGAVAGNTIQMNGKIRIENGGTYSHQTLRGNAYIITKNEVATGTELGTIEFDVPSTASYPISVSGKQYGSLRLISSTEEKRNYVGSGNNDLTIRGNLVVGERTQFNSTLNSNIYLHGNLSISGTLLLSPSVADTTNRELMFVGDSSSYFSNGSLVLGTHFRNIRVQKGTLWLKSAIHINQASSAFIVGPNTRVMLDTFCIVGEGMFKSDSAAVLGIASPDGISVDSSKGNIRTAQQVFSPKTSFIFYGNQEQVSGTGYPLSVASLEINKTNGDLRLTSPLEVSDSLRLSSGRVMSSISSTLHLTGIICADGINQYGWAGGGNNSFIEGPFRLRLTMQAEAYFPIGKNGVFAPLKIQFKNGTGGELEIEYHNNTIAINNKLMAPLKSISNKEYWDIKSTSPLDTTTTNESMILSLRPTHHYNTTNRPFIVRADSLMGEWRLLANSAYDSSPSTIASTMFLKDGVYTIGSMQEEILTAQQINLSFKKDKQQATLEWTIQDHTLEKFIIEKSTDGIKFNAIGQQDVAMNQTESKFIRKVNLDENEEAYFRILGSDILDRQLLSNVVFIRGQKSFSKLYPNPASEELMMRMSDQIKRRKADIQVMDNFGRAIPVSISFETKMMKINIAHLANGLYRLIVISDGKKEVYPFIKSN